MKQNETRHPSSPGTNVGSVNRLEPVHTEFRSAGPLVVNYKSHQSYFYIVDQLHLKKKKKSFKNCLCGLANIWYYQLTCATASSCQLTNVTEWFFYLGRWSQQSEMGLKLQNYPVCSPFPVSSAQSRPELNPGGRMSQNTRETPDASEVLEKTKCYQAGIRPWRNQHQHHFNA